ncbi:MAG: tetratricopeptide repeat protein [Syntrophales bacterium]|nr:tetratricopeptide repeat protein [Syntrophales bacterium]MDD5642216.1 tetratricopeptide repeat protein [Syntrophales bacterium]
MAGFRKNLVWAISLAVLVLTGLGGISWWWLKGAASSSPPAASQKQLPGYAGTSSCRECHEKFYRLWAPSHHGLAMQPVTPEFLKTKIEPQKTVITLKERRYQAIFRDGQGFVREQGAGGEKSYPLAQALGGKNVYYFLTPLDKGRLQVLPVAYDVRKKEWFNATASMIRHFAEGARSEPVSWRDPSLTFNTACYSCHVSQLAANYDPKTDTYHTVWAEPGINCETCHGPAAEHVRVCQEAPQGAIPRDLKIIRGGRDFTAARNNATCAPCHAKMIPLTTSFQPGERFFDHYDLVTLEDRDFYADGRDLGENFTETLWRLSPCAQSGKLSCLHCHTSSGRYRFKDGAKANQACLPCHQRRVEQAAAHIHHPGDKPGTPRQCIACHMPPTGFARMRRTDHSLLPPAPAATMAYKSPNACNLCHQDKDAKWADRHVRQWRPREYQALVLHRAGLVDAARKRDWTKLPAMLQYLNSRERNEIYAASLLRLLAFCPDNRKWPAIRQALKDRSPLVRGAAASALAAHLTPETVAVLLACLDDNYRLVRLRAAASLAPYPRELLSAADQQRLAKASRELLASLLARPDDWTSYYNLGNFYLARQEFSQALEAFRNASRLQPASILPLVNISMVYARLGRSSDAGAALRQALTLAPENPTANFNLGLLLAEQGRLPEAEAALRTALKANSQLPEAAYNLGVLLAQDRLLEALPWCQKAHAWQPENPRYAFTLAFYLRQQGNIPQAMTVLAKQVRQHAANADIYFLLGELYEKTGRPEAAKGVYRQALADKGLPESVKHRFEIKLRALTTAKKRQ